MPPRSYRTGPPVAIREQEVQIPAGTQAPRPRYAQVETRQALLGEVSTTSAIHGLHEMMGDGNLHGYSCSGIFPSLDR